ncbi:MAG: MetQ/NlpA family ABC transporter substrate-binding protein, partial [Succinivibrio sp.]
MNLKSLLGKALLVSATVLTVTACGEDKKELAADTSVPESIKIGVVPGPYREILDQYLKPVIEKKGHKLEFVEFTDWVQPDSSLDAGDIDANLFQHQAYLNGIVQNQGLKLSSVVNFPTLGIYVFSDKYSSLA